MTKRRHKNIAKDKNWSLVISHWSLGRGFTLVELIVSMAITGILMLGMSAFFSSTFRNMFEAQSRSMSTERQFAINEIIRNKFSSLDFLIKDSADYILSFNKNTKNQLPFSYIGTTEIDSKNYLAFRDIMLFNKIFAPIGGGAHIYANANSGELRKAADNTSAGKTLTDLKNVGGFVTKDDVTYYVAMPNENVIRICATTCNAILNVSPWTLSTPMDIETDGNNFYISDSGNNRIIMVIMKPDGTTVDETKIIAEDLNFPTGLSYYDNGAEEFLFAADTFNHKIKRITVPSPPYDVITVVGDGEDGQCNKTAKFCKLNLPTGVFAYAPDNELYIADGGNNRILKMSDPEPIEGTATNLQLEFELDDYYAWDKIVLSDVLAAGDLNITSNLLAASYHNGDRKIQNDLPPVIVQEKGTSCTTQANKLYVTDNLESYQDPGEELDHIVINNNAYTINNLGHEADCYPLDPDVTDGSHFITVSENLTNVSSGDLVYVGNPETITAELANIEISEGGFQTIQIDTYSIENIMTPVETDYTSIRVGNNILGTEEDKIEVIAANIDIDSPICTPSAGKKSCVIKDETTTLYWDNKILFPTGVTNAYFISSGNGKVFKLIQPSNEPGNTMINFDETAVDSFDYISDFELAAVDPITFTKYNCAAPDDCSILELEIATVNQTYKLNAAIP